MIQFTADDHGKAAALIRDRLRAELGSPPCRACRASGCPICGGGGWMATHRDERSGTTYPLCLCCYYSPAPDIPVPGQVLVVTRDGEVREGRRYPGGAWDCPFCGGANDPASEWHQRRGWPDPCANPACMAGGGAPRIAAIRAERKLAEQSRVQQQRARDFATAAAERARREQDQRIAQAHLDSEAEGWCFPCWAKSTGWGRYMSRPVTVRHRAPENCPQARRRNRGTS